MFETSLIDIQKSQSKKTPGVMATSAGLHVALLAAALSAAYWQIEPVAEPMENAVFVIQAALPPPPAGGTRLRKETAPPKPTAPVPPQTAVQPKAEEISETIPKADETPTSSAPADPLIGTESDSGPTPGLPGTGDGPNSGFDGPGKGSEVVGPGVLSDQPYKLTGAIARPVLLSRVEPLYPETARRAHQEGTVILETVIDESGRVVDVTVVKGLGFGLQQAAIDAVSRWRFKPATMNGRPVKVFFNLTVQFSLN